MRLSYGRGLCARGPLAYLRCSILEWYKTESLTDMLLICFPN